MQLRQIKEFELINIIRLLSLDVLTEFYSTIGLTGFDEGEFLFFFKQMFQDTYTLNKNLRKGRYGLSDYFQAQMLRHLTEKQKERLIIWLNVVGYASHHDSINASSWNMLFFRFVYDVKYKITVAGEISNWKEIRKKYLEFFDDTQLLEQYKSVREKMLSDWDLEIFTIMDFCYFDEEQDPYEEIKDLFDHYALLNFVEYLVTSSDQHVLNEILNYGTKLLKELKIYHPGELVGLKELLVNIEFSKLKYVDRQ